MLVLIYWLILSCVFAMGWAAGSGTKPAREAERE